METTIDTMTCSERFLRGVKWLENELRFDKDKVESTLKDRKEELKKQKSYTSETYIIQKQIEELDRRLKYRYLWTDVEAIYVLSKVDSNLVNDFALAAESHPFLQDAPTPDDVHKLWNLANLGSVYRPDLIEEIDWIEKEQTKEGYMHSNQNPHTGPMRVLVAVTPKSKNVLDAIDYWLGHRKERHLFRGVATIAIGILALAEFDCEAYSRPIGEEVDFLKKIQNENGSWSRSIDGGMESIEDTAYTVWAISRVEGIRDSSAQEGLKWLYNQQTEDGSWADDLQSTASALLALLAMGEGPKVPKEIVDVQLANLEKTFEKQKPVFIHTSPIYHGSLHVKEIHDKVFEMIHRAEEEIRIASPFIDMLYEEIINLANEKPELIVKIICRPKKEVGGMRERIAKNVIDLLNIAARGNVVQTEVVHSRIVIIDEKEVLVSSADLTRDQLFDEFNAGIWTSDRETVERAIEFFDNTFELEKQ